MKQYLQAIFPAEFKRSTAFWRAFVLGLVMVVLAVLQLFQFEDFPGIIEAMGIPGGKAAALSLAVLFPFLEIASLPFLFSMKTPPLIRRLSKSCAVAVGVLWLIVTVWTSINQGSSVESGIFGASLTTTSGWWSVVFTALLMGSVYLTIGELPRRRQK